MRVSVRRCALRWESFVLLLFLSFIIIFFRRVCEFRVGPRFNPAIGEFMAYVLDKQGSKISKEEEL